MNRIVIDNGTLVNEGRRFNGYIVIEATASPVSARAATPAHKQKSKLEQKSEQQRGRKQALPPASRPA